jgi:hypothetical protein
MSHHQGVLDHYDKAIARLQELRLLLSDRKQRALLANALAELERARMMTERARDVTPT